MELREAIETLLLATRADGRSPKTVEDYVRKLRPLVEFLGESTDVDAVTTTDLRRYVVRLQQQGIRWEDHPKLEAQTGRLSPYTVAGYVRAAKRLFNFLEAEGLLESNPSRRIKQPVPNTGVPKAITEEDFMALLKTTEGNSIADVRDRAVILLLGDSGARVGGISGLRLEDVDLERGVAWVTEKGEKTRAAAFCDVTATAMADWLTIRPTDCGPWVFTSLGPKAHGALSTGAIAEMLKRRAKKAGIAGRVNPHAFRHAFAREFLKSGGNLSALSDLMGHASVEVTKRFYAVFTLDELKEQHRKHSPINRLFGGGEKDADASRSGKDS